MRWERQVRGLEQRRELAKEHGGTENVAKQHSRGRATVRERIDSLVDSGSFAEIGSVAGLSEEDEAGNLKSFSPANVVMGTARIDGRPVVVCGDDFTIGGAAYSGVGIKKGIYGDELAVERKIPMLRLLEGGGAKITGGTGAKNRSGYDLTTVSPSNLMMMKALQSVPVVCLALGPVAGFPAARLVGSHLSIMTRDTAQVLIGGPALVERAMGQKITKEELGGPQVATRSGVVDNVVPDEAAAFDLARSFLSYLPSHAGLPTPVVKTGDPPDRREDDLLELLPEQRRRAYKMRRIIERVFDSDSFLEMSPHFGRSQITGLARLDGQTVGVFANDPVYVGGSMTADSARKVRRFIEFCDLFNVPIVALVDEPGFLIGLESEREGTIRYGVEALFASLQSRVPWASVIIRRSFGVAAGIHLGPGATVFAWPSVESGAMPLEGGVALAYRKEIADAPDPEARRRELEDEVAKGQSVFPRAEEFGVHELIDPRETRPMLCRWLEDVQFQLQANLSRGMPLYGLRP